MFFIFYTFMADPLVVSSFLRGWMVCVLWVFFGCFNLIVVFFLSIKKYHQSDNPLFDFLRSFEALGFLGALI